ncbi:Lrp/AsnC family transcriptional regulator [Pseudonocardia spinosispora]|uniref:Lrp/AsnC family transcriptional regulator n=1 Tax=Pseudonocardia spinosispora TaxID=103441 RepID=UPI000426918D|nr:Lrp/AsnC family transcriptional regulator [Pseudonocardia spinosispora]
MTSEPGQRETTEQPRPPHRGLDDVDRALISLLQRDGRMSFTNLAKAVDLSEGAVRQRVQRLLRDQTMQIVAVTDPLDVDLARQAMVAIKVRGDVHRVAAELAALPDAHYVVLCAGRYDLLVEVICHDDAHLLRLLNEQIRTIDGIADTETFTYLKLAKQTYAWGALTD